MNPVRNPIDFLRGEVLKNTMTNKISYGMNKLRNIYWAIIASMLFFSVNIVFAQEGGGLGRGNELQNPIKFDTIKGFLDAILGAVVTIATPIVVLMLVYSGFLFVKAQGNPEKLTDAKRAIMWTIIGAVIVLGAFVLSSAIKGTVDDIKKGPSSPSSPSILI
jgi:heme/copper-type cytochrome/quinol oxidase subunit 2